MTKTSEQLIDAILVMDCQAGRTKALEALVCRWQKRLWSHANRLVGDPEAAWDITQQTWLAILQGLRKLRDPAGFKTWAYRITTNKAIDWMKKSRRQRHAPLEDVRDPQSQAPQDTRVTELLEELDIKKKVVLSLYYFEGLTIPEISSTLNIPPGTVKSRLHNAKQQLRDLWHQYFDE